MRVRHLVVLVALLWPATAWADLPPDPDYVEQCTIERQQREGELCESCGTYHGEPDKCATQYDGTAFARRCKSAGASVWDEVWCRPLKSGETPPVMPKPPSDNPGASCAMDPRSWSSRDAATLIALLALGAFVSRRRRT